jgi:predicted phage-related endonuclease
MGELVRLTFPDRAQWLAGRRRGIGGSEAAAAIGRSPWKTALMENGADAVEGENRGASRT